MDIKASQIHDLGYNCAQSVFCALTDITGLSDETSLALTGGLGGGMRAAQVCGAVSGAILASRHGLPFYSDCTDAQAKDKIAALTREFHARFQKRIPKHHLPGAFGIRYGKRKRHSLSRCQ